MFGSYQTTDSRLESLLGAWQTTVNGLGHEFLTTLANTRWSPAGASAPTLGSPPASATVTLLSSTQETHGGVWDHHGHGYGHF